MITPSEIARLRPQARQALKLKIQLEQERRRRRRLYIQQAVADDTALWTPNDGPQAAAFANQADILGYGGAAGGGKTDLLLGLAATQHQRSVIFRRVFPNLRGVIERSREIYNPEGSPRSGDSYNETLHRWQFSDGRMVEFEACQYEKDKEKQRGRPRDFYGFDEATEFSRSQIEFILAWLRSTDPKQRCRAVLTFNPPTDAAGSWIVDYFLPWLAFLYPEQFRHPNPARPGELRWYATLDGEETELPNGKPFEHEGEVIRPLSRSFIPAKLEDNPYLDETGYRSVLQSLPEPLRSQLLFGDFGAGTEADPWQAIPATWVRLAQDRWLEQEKPGGALSAVGVDVARGGRDKAAVSLRYGTWFAEIESWPGRETIDGPAVAAVTQQTIGSEDPGLVNIDVIGVGGSAYDTLKTMYPCWPVNVAEGSSYYDRSGTLKMRNLRAEIYWRLREALDPEHGDNLALPPGNELLADLCAARYKLTAAGIQIEDKEAIKERIGRSPDVGEALLLAHYWPDIPVDDSGVYVDEEEVAISPY